MANEATLVFETHIPIPFTCANSTGIEKGAVLKMTDPMTAIITSAAVDTIAGICAGEKIASDGNTKVAVYRGGVFKVYLSGSCTVGDPAVTDSTVNFFKSGKLLTPNQMSGATIAGIFLETGTTGETVLMELRPETVGAV